MKKKIMSIVMVTCIMSSFLQAYAEDTVNDEQNNAIISTEAFTDENVIYSALQDMNNGVSLFSDAPEEITADFDVVLGFDMSSDMYGFDYNGEMAWKDDFAALQEQAPAETRFSVVTGETGEFGTDLSSMISTLPVAYSGSSDIVSLLENSADTFDDEADDRNKVVIATTAEVSDSVALENEMNELRSEGIVPFVFVLDDETITAIEDNNVYSCVNDLELRIAISDIYLSFTEFSNASMILDEANTQTAQVLKSDYKDRDKFVNSEGMVSEGLLMASILNKYKCVPMKAQRGDLKYDLKDSLTKEQIQDFLYANNSSIASMPSDFVSVWNNIFNIVSRDESYTTTSDSEIYNVLERNLKRRFPVLISNKSTWYIASSLNNSSVTYIDFSDTEDTNKTIDISDIESIIDIYEYLMTTAVSAFNLIDTVTTGASTISIRTAYPADYALTVNSGDSNDTVRKDALDSESGSITFSVGADNTLLTEIDRERHFFVESLVTFDDVGISNIYGANKEYQIKFYRDVDSDEWYYDYLFKATNLEMINGDENSMFNPNDSVTLAQFLKMLLKAANIDCDDEPEEGYWASVYFEKANEIQLTNISADQYEVEGSKVISRGETAQYIYDLFFDETLKHNVNVATVLYEYPDDTDNYKSEAFDSYQDVSDSTEHIEAIYQLYLNNVLNGYSSTEMGPNEPLTRAQVCAMLIRCLFNLDEDTPQILANIEENSAGEDIVDIELTSEGIELDNIVFDNNGSRQYNIVIEEGDTDRYYAELTSGEGVNWNVLNSQGVVCQNFSISGETVYVIQGAGVYSLHLTKSESASGNVSLKITDMDAAQYLEFTPQPGGKYIYSNNREVIQIEDLADSNNPNGPQLLFRQTELKTGTYTLMLTHRSDIDNFDIYLDIQFYDPKKNSQINITKYGDDLFGNGHGINGVGQKSWACIAGYAGYLNDNIGRVRTQTADVDNDNESMIIEPSRGISKIMYKEHNFQTDDDNSVWLSELYNNSVTEERYPYLKKGEGMYIMMEFEIISMDGINISIAAFEANEDFNSRFDNYIPTDSAPYKEDDALKGMAEFMPQTQAELTFFADDNTGSNPDGMYQTIKIINPFNTEGKATMSWKTHMNPQYEKWNADLNVESDILPLYYEDDIMPYTFDTKHDMHEGQNEILPTPTIIPKAIDEYGNEIVDENGNPIVGYGSSNHDDACNMGNYGVCTTYKVSVVNTGSSDRAFIYRIEKGSNIVLSVRNENGDPMNFKIGNDTVSAICTGQANEKEGLHPITDEESEIKVLLPEGTEADNITELQINVPAKTKTTFYIDEVLPTGDQGSIITSMIIR